MSNVSKYLQMESLLTLYYIYLYLYISLYDTYFVNGNASQARANELLSKLFKNTLKDNLIIVKISNLKKHFFLIGLTFGTLNVRGINENYKIKTLVSDIKKYKLDIVTRNSHDRK